MKKRIFTLLLVIVFFALQIPAFASASEMNCSSPEAPFSMVIRDQTADVVDFEFDRPVTVYNPTTFHDGPVDTAEWPAATLFGETAVFTITNNSADVIGITYHEYRKAAQPLYFGMYGDYEMGFFNDASLGVRFDGEDNFSALQGQYYTFYPEWMTFVNKPGTAFELHSYVDGDLPYYAVKKGETVTFQIPVQDQSLCELYIQYYDSNGNQTTCNGYYSWRYRLMRNDAAVAQSSAEHPSDWAKEEVNAAIDSGLVPENLQHNYTAPVSRADVAQMFVNLIEKSSGMTMDAFLAKKGVEINPDAFTDTTDKAVLACNALGIISGVGNNKFSPDGTFTRGQIAAILNRIAGTVGIDTNGYTHNFTDVKGHWCSAELGWPVHAGIISGVGNNKFDPDGALTTEQAIALAYRAMSVMPDYR